MRCRNIFRSKKISRLAVFIAVIVIGLLGLTGKSFANLVEYRGEAEGLVTAPDDFFINFGELMPGDIEKDFAYIRNSTDDDIEVFFKTEPLAESEYYDDIDYSLLEKIKLKISLKQAGSDSEQILYEGNLGAEQMSEYISLGTYKKGFDGEFLFEIEVPAELKNSYTLSSTKVKWIFAVEKKADSDDNNKNGNNANGDNNGNSEEKKSIIEMVKTGDVVFYSVIGLVVAVGLLVFAIKKKKSKKEK